MTERTVNRTESFFDSYAKDFNAIYGNEDSWFSGLINRWFRRSMRLRYEMTLQACDPIEGKTVLDVGCGPGHYSIALAKMGAGKVIGLDFAESMIELARRKAEAAGVSDRSEFITGDFFALDAADKYDYLILMGFMDYMENAGEVVDKALSLTERACFFSFPSAGGLLAWQRKLRYKSRCPLYLYTKEDLIRLFSYRRDFHCQIRKIDRDYWVSAVRR